ncbi:hypothetical protein O181_062835, partial [Austropuccinia psidii MF-1]|nr:hypothetical protein [Austropuccinia psidii MF-1]
LSCSFFVGDAAGRPAKGSIPKDWTDTDRKMALNIGISFFTPEEYFCGEETRTDFILSGFDPLKYDHDQPAWHPATTPLALGPILTKFPDSSIKHSPCEIVLFVGPPSVGKTTLFKNFFAPRGYKHVNQDTLKSFDKCHKTVAESIKASQSCVVDNTNPSKQTRSAYVLLARKLSCQIRCVYFTAPIELAKHNNVYRVFHTSNEDSRSLLPTLAFSSYAKNFEEPALEEGFDEMKKVNFVFEGTESERSAWHMYLV